jgi:pimeloyl-ACP methyl ester carboxylesterase
VIVLVHGVPETAALWDKLRSHLDGESVALSLPGFGCPRPAGFGATKDDYARWVLSELEKIEGPIDLVGHDWGATITNRIATAHGDRLRSWATDNLMHPDYVWHDLAQIWQTPGEGEKFWEGMLAAAPDQQAAAFEGYGVSSEDARALVERVDGTMTACILALYRSAVPNPFADWGYPFTPTAAPGLVLLATEEPFGNPTLTVEAAGWLGARTHVLEGLGHWWALQDPAAGAQALNEFHASLR